MNGHFNGNILWTYLREIITYKPKTGVFWWNERPDAPKRVRQFIKENKPAGAVRANGYRYITIAGKSYLCSRLAYFWMTGYWPAGEIDHKNRVCLDNTWKNLRVATRSQNMANTKIFSNNTSGIKGVHWNKEKKKWVAHITINYKTKNLGYFSSIVDARRARQNASKKHQQEFAREK